MKRVFFAGWLLLTCLAQAEEKFYELSPADANTPVPWNLTALSEGPETFPALQFADEATTEITPLFFRGQDYEGKKTRVFAWVGMPTNCVDQVPGVVLVHGAGCTAFKEWVQLWVDRGYAAIAMDTAGGIPRHVEGSAKLWQRHEFSGPAGWGDMDNVDKPMKDQWTYHAVAAVIRAHTLLRSYSQVDKERTGIVGISWGGYLTSIVSGVDTRFKFAAPIYGCGFLGEGVSNQKDRLVKLGDERAMKWLTLWDPSRYVWRSKIPMLFIVGCNDPAYPLNCWQKTAQLPQGDVRMSCRVKLSHSQSVAQAIEDVYAFANSQLKGGEPLPKVTAHGYADKTIWLAYQSPVPLKTAELHVTSDSGPWKLRIWQTISLPVDESQSGKISAELPVGITAAFLSITDSRGMIISAPCKTFE